MSSGTTTKSSGSLSSAYWSQRPCWWQESSWLSGTTTAKSSTSRPGGGCSSLLVSFCRQHFGCAVGCLRRCWHELSASTPGQGAAQRGWLPGASCGILTKPALCDMSHSLHSLCDMSHSLHLFSLLPAAGPHGAHLFSHGLPLQRVHSLHLHCRWASVNTVPSPCLCVGFYPIYWISRAVIHLLVLMVETTAFTTKKAVYYTIGTRVSSTVAAPWTGGGHAAPVVCGMPAADATFLACLGLPSRTQGSGARLVRGAQINVLHHQECAVLALHSSSTCPFRCCRLHHSASVLCRLLLSTSCC